jgi:hypothetical protein
VDDERYNNRLTLLFFATAGLFLLGCVWYLAMGAINPEYYWRSPAALAADQPEPRLPKNGRILLVKDQAMRVDDARIVYRGNRDGILCMDLFLLALDPHYGYPHRIDEARARQGFFIGDFYFQVLVAGDDKISLQRL